MVLAIHYDLVNGDNYNLVHSKHREFEPAERRSAGWLCTPVQVRLKLMAFAVDHEQNLSVRR